MGRLAAGTDADVLILEGDGRVGGVYARGCELVRNGKPLVWGAFGGHTRA